MKLVTFEQDEIVVRQGATRATRSSSCFSGACTVYISDEDDPRPAAAGGVAAARGTLEPSERAEKRAALHDAGGGGDASSRAWRGSCRGGRWGVEAVDGEEGDARPAAADRSTGRAEAWRTDGRARASPSTQTPRRRRRRRRGAGSGTGGARRPARLVRREWRRGAGSGAGRRNCTTPGGAGASGGRRRRRRGSCEARRTSATSLGATPPRRRRSRRSAPRRRRRPRSRSATCAKITAVVTRCVGGSRSCSWRRARPRSSPRRGRRSSASTATTTPGAQVGDA